MLHTEVFLSLRKVYLSVTIWKSLRRSQNALLEVPRYHPLSSLLQQTRTDFSWDGINVSAATSSPPQSTLTLLFLHSLGPSTDRLHEPSPALLTPSVQGCAYICPCFLCHLSPWVSTFLGTQNSILYVEHPPKSSYSSVHSLTFPVLALHGGHHFHPSEA